MDPTDISDIVTRFQTAHPDSPLFDESLVPDIQPSELSAFVDEYLSNPTAGRDGNSWTLRERIIAYSLSAIFKDCSIIIRAVLSPSEDNGEWMVREEGSTVKLLDLDLKPLKMRHWAELDEKIWRHWAQTKGAAEEKEVEVKQEEVTEVDVRSTEEEAAPSGLLDGVVPSIMSLFPTRPVETPSIGSGRIVPGGFPDILDVNPDTPGIETSVGSAKSFDLTPIAEALRDTEAHSDIRAETSAIKRKSEESDVQHVGIKGAKEVANGLTRDAEVPVESATSSALSTPMVPGAFNFPDVPRRSIALEAPAKEILDDHHDIDTPQSSHHAGLDTNEKLNPLGLDSTSVPILTTHTPTVIPNGIAKSTDSSPVDSRFSRSLTSSPPPLSPAEVLQVESRFERSTAPSPSPGLVTADEGIEFPSENEPVAVISLASPTFGLIEPVLQSNPDTGVVDEEGSEDEHEREVLINGHEGAGQILGTESNPTPEGETHSTNDVATTTGIPTPSTPTQTFSNHSSLALGPPISPRTSSLARNGVSTPVRPERRRVDSANSSPMKANFQQDSADKSGGGSQ